MPQQYGRTFMQNFTLDSEKHRELFLGYTDKRLENGNSDYQQLFPQDESQLSTDLQLIYDMVDVMAVRDEARDSGYGGFARALDERVQRFFEDVQRLDRQTFDQLSDQVTDEDEDYEDHLEELQENVYDIEEDDIDVEDMQDGLRDLGLDEAGIENVAEVNDIELEIQDAAQYSQLRHSLQRLADAQKDAMQSVSSSYDEGFWDEVADTAEDTGVLDDPQADQDAFDGGLGALDEEIPEDELDASVFGMLKHRLYMKVAPLPDSDEPYLG